jgi:segregation and condensation protein B
MSDTTEKKSRKRTGKITLIEDPYGFSNLEISEAQKSDEELDLDEPVEITAADVAAAEETLDRVADRVREADEASAAEEAEADAEAELPSAETELAAQIAEDQALQEQMKKEEAEAEEAAKAAPSPLLDASGQLDLAEVQSCVEALLFMSDKPMSAKRLRDLLGPEFGQELFDDAIKAVQAGYQDTRHGFELVEVNGGFQFRTKAGRAELARKLVKVQTQRLSTGAMETLAIVAYKQPVMKEDIDKVRGVDSSYFIRGLLDRRLLKITGRSELPGRPMLYATTDEFMELFGLADLSALPPLHEIEKMVPSSEGGNPKDDEDPRVREMRRLVAQMKSGSESLLTYDPKEDARILQEIRERVGSIPTSTPYLEDQKAKEKEAKLAAESGEQAPVELPVGETAELAIAAPAAPEVPEAPAEPSETP